MKAIVLTDHFGNGGAERVASLIVNGLLAVKGNEVHVCVFDDVNNYNMQKENVSYHVLADASKGHLVNAYLKIKNLTKVVKRVNPDVIFSFGPIMAGYVHAAKMISRNREMKIVDSERNDPRFEPVHSWKKWIRNYCYNHADILVCQTPMAVELLRDMYGVTTKKVIIPNPITPNLPIWRGIQSKEIITAARLTEQKNLPILIDAFDKLYHEHSDFHLTIYGEGELRCFLADYIEKKNLSEAISLSGFAKDIHSIMGSSYMYVSSSDYEGISNSMLESLGIGLPCVCTDCPVGGASMFIRNGENGFLTSVGDKEELYLAMKKLVEFPELAKKFSENSKSINEELALEKIATQWIKLVSE